MNKTWKKIDSMDCTYPMCDICKECKEYNGDDDE